jgi:outer membrane lipoprotein-sorting protein
MHWFVQESVLLDNKQRNAATLGRQDIGPIDHFCRGSILRRLAFVLVPMSMLLAIGAAAQNPQLDAVLTQMDQASAKFKSATADMTWDQYSKVVDEHDIQNGRIYFRRNGNDMQMAADFEKPVPKKVVYSGGRVQLYEPRINQITERNAGANRGDVESFLVLGFGGRGHDLPKSYDVTFDGMEAINGTECAKLELVPKSPNIKKMFSKIIVWIDPKQDVTLQQQFFEPSGDNRTTKYSNIKINARVSEENFKIKASGAKVVR